MCNCPKVTFYEVEFKLVGMKVVANHKNCGDFLNDYQFSQFEKELTKYWGFGEKWEHHFIFKKTTLFKFLS